MDIKLNGTICNNDDCDILRWWGWLDIVCPLDVEKALSKGGPDEEAVLYINSPGGDMLAGSEIRSMLKAYKGHSKAVIQSHAASSATIAMSGCDEIVAEPVALICVHNPSMTTNGQAADHLKTAAELVTVKESIMNAYMAKCNMTREELSTLMDEDRWMAPQEALEYGLIDSISEDETLYGPVLMNVAGASCVLPSDKMRAEYHEHVKSKEEAKRTQAKFELLAK